MVSIEKALTPDQASVAAYAGKIKQVEEVTVFLDDGTAVTKQIEVIISWETVMKLLSLIRRRAKINHPVTVFKQN
jgi:hypothetical protein